MAPRFFPAPDNWLDTRGDFIGVIVAKAPDRLAVKLDGSAYIFQTLTASGEFETVAARPLLADLLPLVSDGLAALVPADLPLLAADYSLPAPYADRVAAWFAFVPADVSRGWRSGSRVLPSRYFNGGRGTSDSRKSDYKRVLASSGVYRLIVTLKGSRYDLQIALGDKAKTYRTVRHNPLLSVVLSRLPDGLVFDGLDGLPDSASDHGDLSRPLPF